MIKARVTTEDEQGNQISNKEVLLADQEDLIRIQETFEADMELQIATALRFDALEKATRLQGEQILLLLRQNESLQAQVRELHRRTSGLVRLGGC